MDECERREIKERGEGECREKIRGRKKEEKTS